MSTAGWLLMLVAMTATGCQGNPGDVLVAQPDPPLADVPLPAGFELEDMRSRSWNNPSFRAIDYLFEGQSDKFAVVRFLERQMPISRWTLTTNRFTQGRAELDFQKNKEQCHIAVYDSGGLFPKTYIHVAIWPRNAPADLAAPPE